MERSAIVIPARTKGKKVERSSGCCIAKYFYLDVAYAGVYADGHGDQWCGCRCSLELMIVAALSFFEVYELALHSTPTK
jgi:hypothetical protein